MDINEATGDPGEGVDRDRVAAIEADPTDWGRFLSAHRDRLRRMVALRLDQRLRGRIDPSDVIQEAFLEATERRPEYVRQPDPMPPFLWLRFLTLQRLQLIHRQQLGTRSRDAAREVSIHAGGVSRGDLGGVGGAAPWAATRARARRRSGPRKSDGCKKRSTAWTRSTAKCLSSGTSNSSPTAKCAGAGPA